MPRRNNRRRRRPFNPGGDNAPTPSYEALAYQLVASGKCSPLILEKSTLRTENRNHQ